MRKLVTLHSEKRRKSIKTALTSGLALGALLFGTAASASSEKVISGCYTPKWGYAESVNASADGSQQLGLYHIVLKRDGWSDLSEEEKKRTKRRFTMKGPFKGLITDPNNLVLSHLLSDKHRRGTLSTENDTFQVTGFGACDIPQAAILIGTETLRPVSGTGIYQGLQPNGEVLVQGVVNGCPTSPEFGNNDFEVVPDVGGLCFD